MKRLFVILSVLFLGTHLAFAQDRGQIESFLVKALPDYNTYFNGAELTVTGKLSISASDGFAELPVDEKGTIIGKIMTAWRDSVILVHYGSKGEIWGRSAETGHIKMLDAYDLNAMPFVKTVPAAGTDSRSHPWFVYLGLQLGGDGQNNINFAFNTRLGFYLLKNRWDLATTLSAGFTGNTVYSEGATGWANAGLMSRVHFPIPKIGLTPNVGAQVTVNVFGTTPARFTGALVLGVSWFVGIGNLDLSINIGDPFSGAIGYTMSPGMKHNK